MASHEFSLLLLCGVIGLTRSSFYYKSQASDDSKLRSDIEGVCLRYTRYGYRRVLGRLQRKGYTVGHNRVNRLMGEMDLSVRPRRRRIRTTRSDGSHPKYPNLLKGLVVIRPDQVWCADITYISLANSGIVYLAFLIDVFTRMVRGWYLSRGMSEELKEIIRLTYKVIDQTTRRVIHDEFVPACEKIVSIFEPHTDIIVKDRRDTFYGHKVCLTGGCSNLITDCLILDGNPADTELTDQNAFFRRRIG